MVTKDTNSNMWFATAAGVSRFNGTAWTRYTTTQGIVNNTVNSVTSDTNGNIWIGTAGGASFFNGTTWTNHTTTPTGLVNNTVRHIVTDNS
jgi:ligand-binding sensor domain-containing protein